MGDDDTEMIPMNHIQLQHQNSPKSSNRNGDTLVAPEIYSDDDDSVLDDDGSRGLLTGSIERTYDHERRKPPPSKLWPQIKSIVIEVRVNYSHKPLLPDDETT